MRVLYIATSFPEPEKGATIYTDLAEALYEAGHEVTVAVSEQARNKQKTEMKKERGFDVLRIVTGNYYDVGLIEKGITTLKIPILMKQGITKYLGNKEFDLILFEAPPVTNAGLVAWAKKKYNCPSYLMLKDIFPQNAVDLGIIKNNSLVYKYFLSKEKRLYRTADIIGSMSAANMDYILKHNPWLDSGKVEIFPNTKKITTLYKTNKLIMRNKFNIPDDACVFVFGGNMGKPQYIDLLCSAVKECKNEKGVFFLFIGRGTERYKLEKTIREYNIKNALAIENLPRIEYEQIIKECDVGLIILDPRFTIPNYPSRILSYMEYSKPVLAATDRVSDLKDLIEEVQCGEWVWSGDTSAFISKIKEMSKMNELQIKGINGRKYIEKYLTVENSVDLLNKHFN
ncbi:glycosyltransferase family 4 protein [Neobacillus sp. LXY-1]|uniref:glycosyltransferase family 4 protein n=1 Tax=Neobacillus sp. LXY-1 TaxID=3379133 RepID=UPI003EDF6A98